MKGKSKATTDRFPACKRARASVTSFSSAACASASALERFFDAAAAGGPA